MDMAPFQAVSYRLIETTGGGGWVLTIELTRGSSWSEPVETIERRDCDTISIEFAAAEALHWLLEIQKNAPARGAPIIGL